MRFLCVNQPARADIFGQRYQLKPIDPCIANIEDILVTDNFSASELLSRHKEVLVEVSFDTENLKGYPRIVNRLSDLEPGGRILIIRNGGIGDHIMLLPALRVYREMFPTDSKIWLATQKEKHPLFYNNSNIDQLYSLPLRLNALLKADYLVDFSSRDDWYDLTRLHMTDSYLNYFKIDYRTIKDKTPEIAWDRGRSPRISNLFDVVRKSNPHKPLVLLNWKASNRLRDLPPEKVLFLIKKVDDVLFVVAQSKEFSEDTAKLVKKYGNRIFDCSPEMGSLEDYMAAVANCDAVVSTDTAAGHLAEALGKPSLVIYGPARDDLWIRYHDGAYPVRAEYSGKTCQSPCGLTKNTEDGCPEAILLGSSFSPCLLSITDERIESAFIKIMESIY